jgi:hypothetical protein
MISIPGKSGSMSNRFGSANCRTIILGAFCFIAGFAACYLPFREPQLKTSTTTTAPISYAFDQSFMRHFGADGVRAVNRLMRRGISEENVLDRQFRLELAVEQVRYDHKLGE